MPISLAVGGFACYAQQWPKPVIIPAIDYLPTSSGKTKATSRGASQDVYQTTLTFQDVEDNINALESTIDIYRLGDNLTLMDVPVFSPEVNHTGTIACTVFDFGRRKQLSIATNQTYPTNNLVTLDVVFRAISPALIGTTPSSSGLRLISGWEMYRDVKIGKSFTYSQVPEYADNTSDAGCFNPTYSLDITKLRAVLAYLLTTGRTTPFAMANFQGPVKYPFGVPKGNGSFNCLCKKIQIERKNVNRWNLSLSLCEA